MLHFSWCPILHIQDVFSRVVGPYGIRPHGTPKKLRRRHGPRMYPIVIYWYFRGKPYQWSCCEDPIYLIVCRENLSQMIIEILSWIVKAEGSTRLPYNRLWGGLEHLKIETRLTDERFVSVMTSVWFKSYRCSVYIKSYPQYWNWSLVDYGS